MSELPSGREWITGFAARLGVDPPDEATIEALLDLAGVAAHASERIAAPIACYLVGRAGITVADARGARMTIRDATVADLDAVADLVRALADYEELAHEIEWDLDQLGTTLFGPGSVPRTLVAVDDDGGEVVGIAIWFPTYSTFQGRPGIWLEDLFVRPEHRGAGHGRALLQALFDRADGGRVEWAVLDWNEPSIRFYESLGARPVAGWTRYRWLDARTD